jgi:hypothetical protein
MKLRIASLFLLLVACTESKDKSYQNNENLNNQNSNRILVITSSDKIPPYVISKELTFDELLKGESYSDTIFGPDTLFFKLNESIQLISITPTDEIYPQSFLVNSGDTLDVKYIKSKIHVNRLENGKFKLAVVRRLWTVDSLWSVDRGLKFYPNFLRSDSPIS